MAATSAPGGAAPPNESAPPDRRRWLNLALIGLAQLITIAARETPDFRPGKKRRSTLPRVTLIRNDAIRLAWLL